MVDIKKMNGQELLNYVIEHKDCVDNCCYLGNYNDNMGIVITTLNVSQIQDDKNGLRKEDRYNLINKYIEYTTNDDRLIKGDVSDDALSAFHYGERMVWNYIATELGFDFEELNKVSHMINNLQSKHV